MKGQRRKPKTTTTTASRSVDGCMTHTNTTTLWLENATRERHHREHTCTVTPISAISASKNRRIRSSSSHRRSLVVYLRLKAIWSPFNCTPPPPTARNAWVQSFQPSHICRHGGHAAATATQRCRICSTDTLDVHPRTGSPQARQAYPQPREPHAPAGLHSHMTSSPSGTIRPRRPPGPPSFARKRRQTVSPTHATVEPTAAANVVRF